MACRTTVNFLGNNRPQERVNMGCSCNRVLARYGLDNIAIQSPVCGGSTIDDSPTCPRCSGESALLRQMRIQLFRARYPQSRRL